MSFFSSKLYDDSRNYDNTLIFFICRPVNMPELTELDKAASSEPTKVELVGIGSATDSDSDDTIPELEDAGTPGTVGFPGTTVTGLPIDMVSKAKQSRGEKKARKLMSKLGLKPVC